MLGLLPALAPTASVRTSVSYLDENGVTQTAKNANSVLSNEDDENLTWRAV